MKKASFSYDRTHCNKSGNDNMILMSGKFTGKPCDAYIQITPMSKIICKVGIHFVGKTWEAFQRITIFWISISWKRQEWITSVKRWKMQVLLLKAKNWGIVVEISKLNTVSITYGNDINLEKGKQEYEERLLNEI